MVLLGETKQGSGRKAILTLAGLGLAMELLYVATMLVPFYLPAYYAVPLLDLGKMTSYGRTAGLAFLGTTILLFGLYYGAFRLVRAMEGAHGRAVLAIITTLAALFSVTLALAYPFGAADIFDYVMYGRIVAYHGANPFLRSPVEFSDDPFLPYVAWQYLPFTYGPLWAAFSALLSRMGGDALLSNLLLYKGLAIAAYGASLWLIHDILSRLAPRYALAGLLLFAWNPLVVTETAANGHNDAVMMAFVLLALRLALTTGRWQALAIAGLAGSALVKFVTAMLAPLYLVSLWRQPGSRPRRAALLSAGLFGSAVLAAILYAPFWEGPATLAIQRRDELFTASLPAIVKLSLEGPLGIGDAKLVGPIVLACFALYCLVEAWRLESGVAPLIAASYRLTLVYLLFACLWFQPWYLIWLLALAALRPGLDIAHQSVLFSFTATLNYFVFVYVWIWNAASLDFLAVQLIAVATIYTLPIIYSLRLLFRARRGAPAPSC